MWKLTRKTLLFVLTLSGLRVACTTILREYVYISLEATWDEAVDICRSLFDDLAVIETSDDNRRLNEITDSGRIVWIGLFDDLSRWRWALENVDIYKISDSDFNNWASNEPLLKSNYLSEDTCTVIHPDGFWHAVSCDSQYSAMCFNGPSTYIFVETTMTWNKARDYCQSNYVDLVSVMNMSDNNQISSLVQLSAWIGLSRRPWSWSDSSPVTFTSWESRQPTFDDEHFDYQDVKSCVRASTNTGMWRNENCNKQYDFVCQKVSQVPSSSSTVTKYINKLKFQSEVDLNDPVVQQQILEQLYAKLQKPELPHFGLYWIHTNGKAFHKEKTKNKQGDHCEEDTVVLT